MYNANTMKEYSLLEEQLLKRVDELEAALEYADTIASELAHDILSGDVTEKEVAETLIELERSIDDAL